MMTRVKTTAFDPNKFTVPEARPLPIFLLLDVSTTMGAVVDTTHVRFTGETFFQDGKEWEVVEGGTSKMDLMNEAIKSMLNNFAESEKQELSILVTVITFGDDARLHLSPTVASAINWHDLEPNGETALGAALKMAKTMIEDKKIIPSRAYRPTIVLVSDGQPNDDWEAAMKNFISTGRSSKCDRMAMAIGTDANKEVLGKFLEGTPHSLFSDDDASTIHKFFQMVTMSVTSRSRSLDPNLIPSSSIFTEAGSAGQSQSSRDTSELEDEGYW